MLNVEETIESLPDMSDDELDQLNDSVRADTELDDDDKAELLEAIDEELEEREEEEGDEEDDVFADEIDTDEDEDELEIE